MSDSTVMVICAIMTIIAIMQAAYFLFGNRKK